MTIQIQMLGDFSFHNQGIKVPLTKSKRTRALMAYLAMTSRPQRRESLCELFWDELDDPKGALRWSLSKIRKFVNEKNVERLIADRERAMLLTNDISIDIHIIKNKLDSDILSVAELTQYLKDLEFPFLEGMDIPSLDTYQRWLVTERLEMDRLYLRVLTKLWEHPHVMPDEKLHFIKVGITKAPYNASICHALLQQLEMLGLIAEKENMLKDFQQRFQDAGIKWKTSLDNAALTISLDATAQSRELLQRQQIKFCKTKDDTCIAYASIGQGYPIVKAANWLTHLEYDWNAPIWSPLFRRLAEQHRVIRYDERGNGLSDWNVTDLSFNAFVDDLDTVVEKANLDKFALLGISQGASVSIEYAIQNPDKVSHLILFGAYVSGWRIDTTEQERQTREAIITLTKIGWGQDNPAYRQIFSSTFLPSANKEELDWFNEFQKQTTSPENAARYLSVFGDIDVRHRLSELNVPTLVIHSLGDQRIPVSVGQDIASKIPNAEFIGLESDSHLLLGREAASTVFIDTVKDFIARN